MLILSVWGMAVIASQIAVLGMVQVNGLIQETNAQRLLQIRNDRGLEKWQCKEHTMTQVSYVLLRLTIKFVTSSATVQWPVYDVTWFVAKARTNLIGRVFHQQPDKKGYSIQRLRKFLQICNLIVLLYQVVWPVFCRMQIHY